MRVLHEGWRLGLHDNTDAQRDITAALRDVACEVEGSLAEAFARYHDALAGEEQALEEALSLHLSSARPLFAAELATAAIREARLCGRGRPSSPTVQLSTDALFALAEVDTPILHRVRVDRNLLSGREFEVCCFAAAGSSNAEIAQRLFLSSRTVEGHLQRAFGKLGIDNRQQLAPPRTSPEY